MSWTMGARGALLLGVLLGPVLIVRAQDDPVSRMIYPEQLREDLAIVRRTIEQAHPDPYRYRTEAEIDTLFANASASFTAPLTAEGFIGATLPVFKAIGDANTTLEPPAALEQEYEHSTPMLPVLVAVIGDRLYLDAELKGFRSLPPGCELLRINGLDAGEVLRRLRASLVADGADTTLLDRRIEQDFPVLYRRFIGPADRFKVEYQAADGSTGEREVMAMTQDEMRQTCTPKGYDLDPWRLEEMPDLKTAWLTLNTLDPDELERRKIHPERFLKSVQEALRKSKAATLVVDVRGASGPDLGMAEQIFALFARKPFRVVRSMSIRSGEVPDSYRYAAPAPNFFASVGTTYLPEVHGRRELKTDDPRLLPLPPQAEAFAGKVYVLADGGTTGAGAAFVMMAHRSGRARTVGEETGSNAASFCGGEMLTVTLPRTNCVLHVPLIRYVPDGIPPGPANRGELPASAVMRRPQDVAHGKDTVREAMLLLINEMQ
jgi:hypothetical protein